MKIPGVDVEVYDSLIADQIACAFEGGINYWCVAAEVSLPCGRRVSTTYIVENPGLVELLTIRLWHDEDPDVPPAVIVADNLRSAIIKMRDEYPSDLGDMMAEDGDADTADLFMQLAAFGEIVYC